MLLAFDIGNSGISFAVIDITTEPAEIIAQSRIASFPCRSADEYVLLIRDILSLHNISTDCITDCAISSVVPHLTDVISDASRRFTGHPPLVIGPGVRTGLNIRVESQTQLGADIVSNTVAALALTDAPCVIVDVGTATTIAAIDCDRTLIGAIICPGLQVAASALSDSASLLSASELAVPTSVIGKNTRDAVNSGVIYGHVYMIDGFVRELRSQLQDESINKKLSLIATGGLAERVLPFCRNKFRIVPALTLLGVAEIFRRNR